MCLKFFWLVALGGLLSLMRLLWEIRLVIALIQQSYPLRKLGRVRMLASSDTDIAFSLWFPGRAYVVIPDEWIADREFYKITVFHEIQHHRAGDTVVAWVVSFLSPFFRLNPFVPSLLRRLSGLQEMACDEALIDRKRLCPRVYGSCLLKAAESAPGKRRLPAGIPGMAAFVEGSILKRRVENMLQLTERKTLSPKSQKCLLFGAALFLGGVAMASAAVVRDRRVTLQEAMEMAASLPSRSRFPITVNEEVVAELNRYVGTPDGRAYIRRALEQMKNHQALVESKVSQYGLPKELLAIPIMESGYQNLPQNPKGHKSAGIWQFIPQTARNFGLTIQGGIDERLNVEKATDAALRYLLSLHARFQDWELAILSYNAGEQRVQRGIEATASRNAWHLISQGYDGDKGYLAKIIAAILILNSPEILD